MNRTWVASVAPLAGGAVAGGVVAGTLSANDATGSSSSSTGQSDGHSGRPPQGDGPGETLVTGTKAATLSSAALTAVPGGAVVRVETDSGDAAYEVHMTRADGSHVTVTFDSDLKETAVESGMGK